MRLRHLNIGCFGGGTGLPSLLGGLKRNPVAAAERRRHHLRQRRQFRTAARRARRPAAGRRAALRAGAGPQRGRGPPRAAVAAADAVRAPAAGRPHRRQPAAVDDGAVQRRLPGRGRRPARPARLPGAACWPVSVTRASLCAEHADGRTTRGEVGGRPLARRRPRDPADLARAAGRHPPGRGRRRARLRRGDHRPGQLLHQPDADPARRRRPRRPCATCPARSSSSATC